MNESELLYQKLTFDDACNLFTDNNPEPISIYLYEEYRIDPVTERPTVSKMNITGCDDKYIWTGTAGTTRHGWDMPEKKDRREGTHGSGYYIHKNDLLEHKFSSKQAQRAINVAANDPNSRLSKMPSEMINIISEYSNKDHVPFKTQKELRGDEAYNKGNIPFIASKDDGKTTYNPVLAAPRGGKVRTRKNRKSRKNKYKKNKSRRKYNKKRHHK
jgi:hypothetical protein